MIKYSFIIPTYKRAKDLENLLLDIASFDVDSSDSFEVLVFNDGEDLETEKVVKSINSYSLKYLFSKQRVNSSKARNNCLKRAKGDWVIFLDDDVRLGKDFIKQIDYITNKYSAFSFRMELPNKKSYPFLISILLEKIAPGKIIPWLGYFVGGFDKIYNNPVEVDHLPGANMIFKKDLLNTVLFDEYIGEGTGYLDDANFSYSVKKKNGIHLMYISSYSIVHLQTLSGGYRQLDKNEWFYYYQNHKFYFFKKYFPSNYRPFIIFFNFMESVIRSLVYRTNLIPIFFKALNNV